MQQNIILSIQDYKDHLPLSERKIADYILEHTAEVISLNAQELAQKAGSSPAAIIRFCHSVHVNGFTDLKLLLSANLGQMSQELYDEVTPGEPTKDLKLKLQARFMHAVERTNLSLEEQAVEAAVALLEQADVIFVFGLGASSIIAQAIYHKFSRLGCVIFTTTDHLLFATALSGTERNGVFIAVSDSGLTKETNRLVKIAKQKQFPVISLTAAKKSPLAKQSDVLLLTNGQEDFLLRSSATVPITSQMYAVDVLFFAYVAKNYTSSWEKIQTVRTNLETLEPR